jgi:hypothetical protein
LEQRIARAWRKNQTRPVTVINLVSEKTIEHGMLETLSNKQALSDGVLDLKGDLKEIKLRSGGQAFLDKLNQLIAPMPQDKPGMAPSKPPLLVDRPLAFAQALEGKINGALLRCEERYPQEGPHSVLFVVVDRDAAQWRDKLADLHGEYFGPGKSDPLTPVRLEIIDRATDEALERLMDAGLVARSTRAIRPLWPVDRTNGAPQTLSDAERVKASSLRVQAGRKLKMCSLLAAGELLDESRVALSDGLLVLGKALAVEHRLVEPQSIEETLLSPLALVWKETLPLLRGFIQDPNQSIGPVLGALEKM